MPTARHHDVAAIDNTLEREDTSNKKRLPARARRTSAIDPAEICAPRSKPVGWKGKSVSKETYAEFGANNALGKNFNFTRRKKGEKGGNKEQKNNGGRGDGNDDGPPENNPKSMTSSALPAEYEGLDEGDDDDLALFEDTPKAPREAKSLFSHEYQDEMRRRVEANRRIDKEFFESGDQEGREKQLMKENSRQLVWQAWCEAKEKALASLTSSESDQAPQHPDDDGKIVGYWVWQADLRCAPAGWDEKGYPRINLRGYNYSFDDPKITMVFQRCFTYQPPVGARKFLWERDLLQIPKPDLSSIKTWTDPTVDVVRGAGMAGVSWCMPPIVYSYNLNDFWKIEVDVDGGSGHLKV